MKGIIGVIGVISATAMVLISISLSALNHGKPQSVSPEITARPQDSRKIQPFTPESTASPQETHATIDNEWALWLINANNPMPLGYAPPEGLTQIGTYNGDSRNFDSRAAEYAISMINAARNDGVTLIPVSSHRSMERQTINFENFYNNALERGFSHDEAFEYTMSQIAVPGTSEHNAGLAIDFNLIEEWFDQTDEFRWLTDNAHKFGFILRYPKGATHITRVIYEPWHFRFVGLYHAEKIYNSDLTLEEYIGECSGDNTVVAAFKQQFSLR